MVEVNPTVNAYLIDDDSISIFLAGFALEGAFRNLTCYDSAERAIGEIVEAEGEGTEPFVVFLDLNMPVMSGWDFLREVSLQEPGFRTRCRVVILSSSIDREEISRSEGHSMVVGFVSKPLDEEAVAAVQRQLLQ